MKIFLTGGSGDLGKVLAHQIQKNGDTALRFDVRKPTDYFGGYIEGSILDRLGLDPTLKPTIQDISETKKYLGYNPQYSLLNLLEEPEKHGEKGPTVKWDLAS